MAGEEAAVETEKRMQRICMITKIEKNPEYSEKLGIKDKSHFRQMEKTRGKEVDNTIFNMSALDFWQVVPIWN